MRTLRLLLAVGLGLAPTLAATTAGSTPAFAGGGAGMTLTATMDGQDQRLLAGTKHLVHITLADTPGEADLRDISITLSDLDPRPLPVDCLGGRNGHLSLEPNESLHCTSVVTAEVGYRTLVARATATVPSMGDLLRTDPLHYDGFMPPPPRPPDPPTDQAPVHAPLTPDPVGAKPRPPVYVAPPPARLEPPKVVDPPDPPAKAGCSGGAAAAAGAAGGCCGSAAGVSGGAGCCGSTAGVSGGAGCCAAAGSGESAACAKPAKPAKHDGLAFTGMSTPMLTGAASGALVLVAGGLLLVRRFARR